LINLSIKTVKGGDIDKKKELLHYYIKVSSLFLTEESTMSLTPKKDCLYEQYRRLGGIINEQDYRSIRYFAAYIKPRDSLRLSQVKTIARFSGIDFVSEEAEILYDVMRTDSKPPGVKHHHIQMCDQRLLAEAFRMTGEVASLQKLISAHPRIDF